MKKLLSSFLLLLIILNVSFCYAANPKVQINGNIIDFKDESGNVVEAQLINNRTMVPLRRIFEELNCSVDWEQETKTVTANRDDKTIILTIGSKDAYLKVGGIENKIVLDSEPVIVENRTLVPLRFIGESLGNDVGWDQANQTAIIIDYEEIASLLKAKSEFMYDKAISANNIDFTKNYYDEANSSRNATTTISTNYSKNANNYTVNVSIGGTSDLSTEIENEGWNEYSYTIENEKYQTSNYVFASMFELKKNEPFKMDYEGYNLSLDKANSLAEWVKRISRLDTGKFNTNTYSELKKDWNKFFNTFFNGKKTFKDADFTYSYIDFARILQVRTSSEAFNALLLLNSLCFDVHFNYKDVMFDYPTFTYEFVNDSNGGVTFKVLLKNEYKEKIAYELSIK